MKTKNTFLRIFCLISLLLTVSETYAEPDSISQGIMQLLRTLRTDVQRGMVESQAPKESPRFSVTSDGYLRNIGAPPSQYFPVASPVPGNPEATARNFLQENANLFGVISSAVDFRVMRTKRITNRDFVRFQQTYAALDVFAGQVIVQVNALGGVEYVMSDIARDVTVLDKGTVSVLPSLSSVEGTIRAREFIAAEYPGVEIATATPQLIIFDPSVVGASGNIHLLWDIKVYSKAGVHVNEHLLLDAHNGKIVRHYPLNRHARDRQVYDADNTDADPGDLERSEGEGATGDPNVDDAYDFLGDTYDFYNSEHGRDSIDDGGMKICVTVKYCRPGDACPWRNAMWVPGYITGGNWMYFGSAMASDDIVGHEYTHGVTNFESNLIYENHSGAINESFSDVWGEFIDLTNGDGNDVPAVRWLIGEDCTKGVMRDMSDPGRSHDPDRLGDPCFVQPVADPQKSNDWGGVHSNCGVNNKLCYLLTDGDTFNGQTVTGMGISAVADLYYLVQTGLLTSGGDYIDLGHALETAAIFRFWGDAERNNLYRALAAVEIFSRKDIYVDWANSGYEDGTPDFPFNTISEGKSVVAPGNRLWIKAGSYDESVTFNKIMQIEVWGSGTVVIGE